MTETHSFLADPARVCLTLNKGPHGFLLLSLVANAVGDIRRQESRAWDAATFNKRLHDARHADNWLMGRVNARLTMDDVAQFHDMDVESLRASIYRQWSDSVIKRFREMPFRKRGHDY